MAGVAERNPQIVAIGREARLLRYCRSQRHAELVVAAAVAQRDGTAQRQVQLVGVVSCFTTGDIALVVDDQRVVTSPTVKFIVTRTASERVVASAAVQDVVAGPSVQLVVSSIQRIWLAEHVAIDDVVACSAVQFIPAKAAEHAWVVPRAADNAVIAGCALIEERRT